MSAPKISVLLPTYNRADVLGCAIGSVLAQTMGEFELLIVGDGCSDRTAEVIGLFDDPRIVWFDLPKAPGFGYANRNFVLQQAKGEFIAYMAHDDLWMFDHLERCLPEFRDPQVDFVYSKPLWVAPDGIIYPITFNLHSPSTREMFLTMRHNALPSACCLHRTSTFERTGYWNEQLPRNADWDLAARIIGSRAGSVKMHREFTTLHFHANWKTAEDVPIHYQRWKEFYLERRGDLPDELALPLPEDTPEQHVFWHLLHESPRGFAEKLRSGLQQMIDLRTR